MASRFAPMRAGRCCFICGQPLPEGSRIDRRYCRETCRVMAHRQRHTDPKPPRGASLGLSPDAGDESTAQSATASAQVSEQLTVARTQIESLEAQCRALRQRVAAAETQLDGVQRRLSLLESAGRRQAAAAGHGAAPSEPGSLAGDGGQDASPGKQAAQLPPWMMLSTDNPGGSVPKWTRAGDVVGSALFVNAEGIVTSLLVSLVKAGHRERASQLRKCQRDEPTVYRQLVQAVARRVVFMPPVTTTKDVDGRLASMLAEIEADLPNPHPSEDVPDVTAWRGFLLREREVVKAVVLSIAHSLPRV